MKCLNLSTSRTSLAKPDKDDFFHKWLSPGTSESEDPTYCHLNKINFNKHPRLLLSGRLELTTVYWCEHSPTHEPLERKLLVLQVVNKLHMSSWAIDQHGVLSIQERITWFRRSCRARGACRTIAQSVNTAYNWSFSILRKPWEYRPRSATISNSPLSSIVRSLIWLAANRLGHRHNEIVQWDSCGQIAVHFA